MTSPSELLLELERTMTPLAENVAACFAECNRLREENAALREAIEQHARETVRHQEAHITLGELFKTVCEISQLTHLRGEVDDYSAVAGAVKKAIEQNRVALAEAQAERDCAKEDVKKWMALTQANEQAYALLSKRLAEALAERKEQV